MDKLKQLQTKYNQLEGRKLQIESDISTAKKLIRTSKKELINYLEAKEFIHKIALEIQQQLQYHVNDITSLALNAVFPEPYKLELSFIQRRNQTECDIFFTKNNDRFNPLEATGGGAVDIAAFALRVAGWSIQTPRKRNLIILDEPMRFVSKDLQHKASLMLKEVSEKLNIQFIIITHEDSLTTYADRIFKVKNRLGKAKVKMVTE